MERVRKEILVDPVSIKSKLLSWAQQFENFIWLDSNSYPQKYNSFEALLAVGTESKIDISYHKAFQKLSDFRAETNDYIFGYLSYDLKNDTENLTSTKPDRIGFSDMFFFQAKKIFILKDNTLERLYLPAYKKSLDKDIDIILSTRTTNNYSSNKFIISQNQSQEIYTQNFNKLQDYLKRGDTYETNFCMEYYAEKAPIDPLKTFVKLNEISQAPFSCFLKQNDLFALSVSPERFVRKEGQKLISQPIKGTARRCDDFKKDNELKEILSHDIKERSENIMVVDLVRNDLSKTALPNTVKVEELCKVYTFKQVHQLISTVISEVSKKQDPVAIIKSLFPMGSMTGVPKIRTMEIIDELELHKRGLYSGAIGYFTPEDDFDFNVVIRSILYNSTTKIVSFSVGGAVTALSKADKEYEECQIKAAAMKKVLSSSF